LPAFPAALQAHLRMVRTVLQRSRPHARPARVGCHRRSLPRRPARRCRAVTPVGAPLGATAMHPAATTRHPLTARSRAPAFDRQLWSRPVSRRAIPPPTSKVGTGGAPLGRRVAAGFLHGRSAHPIFPRPSMERAHAGALLQDRGATARAMPAMDVVLDDLGERRCCVFSVSNRRQPQSAPEPSLALWLRAIAPFGAPLSSGRPMPL
jgi:hypothetical protein